MNVSGHTLKPGRFTLTPLLEETQIQEKTGVAVERDCVARTIVEYMETGRWQSIDLLQRANGVYETRKCVALVSHE